MASLKILLVLAFVHCVFAGKIVKKHCDSESEDFVTCVTDVIQDYFKKNSAGLPEHNLKAVDPLTIPELIFDEEKLGFKLIYKNVKVTGFKDVNISDVKIDKKDGRTEFVMKFDVNAEGDITTELPNGKTFSGTFKYEGTAKAGTKYTYTEKKINNEKTVYDIGPETIICEANNFKETYNKELTDAFDKDPDTQNITEEFKNASFAKEYNEKVLCKMATVVFKEAIDVERNIAKMGV